MEKQKKPLVIIMGRSGAGKTSVTHTAGHRSNLILQDRAGPRMRPDIILSQRQNLTRSRNVTALPTWNTADTATARNGNSLTRQIFT